MRHAVRAGKQPVGASPHRDCDVRDVAGVHYRRVIQDKRDNAKKNNGRQTGGIVQNLIVERSDNSRLKRSSRDKLVRGVIGGLGHEF